MAFSVCSIGYELDNWVSVPNRAKGQEACLFTIMSRWTLRFTQPRVQWALEFFPHGQSSCSVNSTTHLHLMLTLRMCGPIPPFPHRSA